ncbi:MAG: tetratricopeptide repeat protein [Chitinophagaceae bacterium]
MRVNISVAIILHFFFALGYGQDCITMDFPLPVLSPDTKSKMESQLAEARKVYFADTTNADALIWYGRRMAYLGNYVEAIELFSQGVERYPLDARFLRHRGHREITLRCNQKAIIDLTYAAEIMQKKPDEIEPDGMPNVQNIPTSTLKGNIWYHLGLALYLEKDFYRAGEVYKTCLKLSTNPDMYMATAYWLYITLKKSGKELESKALLETVDIGLPLIENEEYYEMLLLYKGILKEEQLIDKLQSSGGGQNNATLGYSMGVYFQLMNQPEKAKGLFKEVLSGNQWSSFGFIAAEKEK